MNNYVQVMCFWGCEILMEQPDDVRYSAGPKRVLLIQRNASYAELIHKLCNELGPQPPQWKFKLSCRFPSFIVNGLSKFYKVNICNNKDVDIMLGIPERCYDNKGCVELFIELEQVQSSCMGNVNLTANEGQNNSSNQLQMGGKPLNPPTSIGEDEDDAGCVPEYMDWYCRVTHRLIGNPAHRPKQGLDGTHEQQNSLVKSITSVYNILGSANKTSLQDDSVHTSLEEAMEICTAALNRVGVRHLVDEPPHSPGRSSLPTSRQRRRGRCPHGAPKPREVIHSSDTHGTQSKSTGTQDSASTSSVLGDDDTNIDLPCMDKLHIQVSSPHVQSTQISQKLLTLPTPPQVHSLPNIKSSPLMQRSYQLFAKVVAQDKITEVNASPGVGGDENGGKNEGTSGSNSEGKCGDGGKIRGNRRKRRGRGKRRDRGQAHARACG